MINKNDMNAFFYDIDKIIDREMEKEKTYCAKFIKLNPGAKEYRENIRNIYLEALQQIRHDINDYRISKRFY